MSTDTATATELVCALDDDGPIPYMPARDKGRALCREYRREHSRHLPEEGGNLRRRQACACGKAYNGLLAGQCPTIEGQSVGMESRQRPAS